MDGKENRREVAKEAKSKEDLRLNATLSYGWKNFLRLLAIWTKL